MWVKTVEDLGLKTTDNLYRRLVDPSSLGKILRQLCQKLTVQVISQQLGAASVEEKKLLNIQENNSLIREVWLLGDDVPWIRGRTIVPYATYVQYKTEFDNLADNLLGETILFANINMTRGSFEYAKQDDTYSRRSLFDLNGYLLMLHEDFLLEFSTTLNQSPLSF